MAQRHRNSRHHRPSRPPRIRDELRRERQRQLLDPASTFSSLCDEVGLDPRLRKALARLGYVRPTLVQSKCLPLAINSGRDLLVRARTGSGKTLAYCLPVLDKILRGKREAGGGGDVAGGGDGNGDGENDFVKALVLVPTRELCHQVHSALMGLTHYCDDVLTVAALAGSGGGGAGGDGAGGRSSSSSSEAAAAAADLSAQEAALRDRPDLIVSTPAGLLRHVRSGRLRLRDSVESIVVDEADLVLSFGYQRDVEEIVTELPRICQGYLLSATLSPELERTLKRVVLHSPAVLRLEDEEDDFGGRGGAHRRLTQFYLTVPPRDKYLVLYVFLKLGVLRGKGLFFVNDTDGGYRLKLFLEQFHIRSAVLNAELPARSRWSVVEQFNAGIFDYLIATDESADVGRSAASDEGRHQKHEEIAQGDEEDGEEEGGRSGQKTAVKIGGSDDSDNEEGSDRGENEDEKEPPTDEEKAQSATSKLDTDEAEDGGRGEPDPTPATAAGEKKKGKKRRRNRKDAEYGVSRGVDFRGVSFVVNVDFPPTASSYSHRVGRTARGGAKGVALSLVDSTSAEEDEALRLVQADQPPLPPAAAAAAGSSSSAAADRFLGGAAVTKGVPASDEEEDDGGVDGGRGAELDLPQPEPQPSPLDFDLGEIEGFRYRVEDVGRAVTRIAVKEARASELKAEMANSERLLRGHFAENPNDLRLLRHDRTATHTAKVQEHLKHVPKYMLPRGMQVAAANKRRKKRRPRNSNNHRGPGGARYAAGDPTRRGSGGDPLRSYQGGDVNLDGVAGGDEEQEFYDDVGLGGDGPSAGDGDGAGDGGRKVFLDTTDGTGRSTAGRNAWKQRHGKGKFGRKRRARKETGW